MYLCTLSDINLISDERDKISFNSILIPLKEKLMERLSCTRYVEMPKNFGDFSFRQYHAFGVEAQKFEDKLDVLVLRNLEFKIKTC